MFDYNQGWWTKENGTIISIFYGDDSIAQIPLNLMGIKPASINAQKQRKRREAQHLLDALRAYKANTFTKQPRQKRVKAKKETTGAFHVEVKQTA